MKKRRLFEKYNGMKLEWLHDSLSFVVFIVLAFILFRYGIGLSLISGDSMYPNLKNGEIVVYNRIGKNYQTGDVVSMRVPSGEYYVKRVIAQGGDVVDIIDGDVYVNGEKLEETWANGVTEEETGAIIFPYTVRENNYFVLGDNRAVSMDSRTFGEVNKRQIRGKIIYVFRKS